MKQQRSKADLRFERIGRIGVCKLESFVGFLAPKLTSALHVRVCFLLRARVF